MRIKKFYEQGKLIGINIFLLDRIEIQVGKSSFVASYFWFTKYQGSVVQGLSVSFQAFNWIQAYRKVVNWEREE